ncbi:MAG: acylneuraminate cytidylyltransferase family protein [Pirellulales bacterium]
MLAGQRILGLIPARGGSSALPRKNVLPLGDKPLIAWTVNAALASKYLDRIALSTDDQEVMEVAKAWGCEVPFRRPVDLAAADTPTIAVVLHALDQLPGFDYVVLLQPTSPLRTALDIDGAVEKCISAQAPSCVSVVCVEKSPHWMYYLNGQQRLRPVLAGERMASRRQDAEPVYVLNGAVYIARIDVLRETAQFVTEATVAYRMPPDRSADVDTELDLRWCEFLLSDRIPADSNRKAVQDNV